MTKIVQKGIIKIMVKRKRFLYLPLVVLIFGVITFIATTLTFGASAGNQGTTPSDPTNVTSTVISACAVNVQWQETSSVDYFEWNARPLPNSWSNFSKVNYTVSGGNYSATWNLLVPNAQYQFGVKACSNIGGCSNATITPQIQTNPLPTVPNPPSTVSAQTVSSAAGTAISLSWNASSMPQYSGFRVTRSDDGGQTFNQITNGTFSVNDFTSNGSKITDAVATSTSHIYRIYTYQTDLGCFDPSSSDSSRQGISSSTQNTSWISFSTKYTSVFVPASPTNLQATISYDQNGNVKTSFSWSPVAGSGWYEFQISSSQNFSGQVTTTTQPTLGPLSFSPNQQFYYEVRACTQQQDGSIGCSAYTINSFYNGYIPPQNFTATPVELSGGQIGASLSWTDAATNDHTDYIYRKISGSTPFDLNSPIAKLSKSTVNGIPNVYPTSYIDNVADSNNTYDYGILFVNSSCQSNLVQCPSAKTTVDLNLAPLQNYAWTAYTPNGGGTGPVGVGWISFSSANETAPNVPYYGVFMSNTTGALSGYAWAGDSPDYGWLSFNPSDLTGCPSGSSSNCTAQVNLTTGQVTGWAKFIGANGNLGAWDGWVSLSGNSNGVSWGVTYSSSTGDFSGEAWGGDVVGWISFCTTIPAREVTTDTASHPTQNENGNRH